ncbi:MAG: GH1 family beta-glucosidase [Propionibacteriaceae bacterium]
MSDRPIPTDFLLGAATAAYQIEGAGHTGGRTDSIWDVFSRVPGAVADGHDGMVACDHYHRYAEDVALMAKLGLDSYRFSTSWARIRPDGGPVNQTGLDFYSRLVDELLAHGITPWLTLYHWDLPQALEDRGGWTNRDTAERFAEYALDVYGALGDRVGVWTTMNEPWCSSYLSYTGGAHAPGRQDPAAGVAAMHHLLLGHGLAVRALREQDADLDLGITLNLTVADPVDADDPGDRDAARRIDGQFNRLFLDPLFRGEYPADVVADLTGLGLADRVRPGDLEIISTPIRTLGVNYYHGEAVSFRVPDQPLETEAVTPRPTRSPYPAAAGVQHHPRALPRTAMDWEIQPEGLTRLLRRVHEEYSGPAGVRLYVTENGAAFHDQLVDGRVADPGRTDYLRAHLAAVLDAVDQGVEVHGYFYWSLLDNFEWAWGYHQRFGLVHVDYARQTRTVKDSGHEYARILAERTL